MTETLLKKSLFLFIPGRANLAQRCSSSTSIFGWKKSYAKVAIAAAAAADNNQDSEYQTTEDEEDQDDKDEENQDAGKDMDGK